MIMRCHLEGFAPVCETNYKDAALGSVVQHIFFFVVIVNINHSSVCCVFSLYHSNEYNGVASSLSFPVY